MQNAILNQMVKLPSGKIDLRDDRKNTKWSVELAAFCLAACPVTRAQYLAVTGENPSVFKVDDNPVESVSWLDAIGFCNGLLSIEAYYVIGETIEVIGADGFRLPREAEWQYACQ